MSDSDDSSEGLGDVADVIPGISKGYRAVKLVWFELTKWVVSQEMSKDPAEADESLRGALDNPLYQKPLLHAFMKYMSQPSGFRERLWIVLGGFYLSSRDDQEYQERLWKVRQLTDDLTRESLESVRKFAAIYNAFIKPARGDSRYLKWRLLSDKEPRQYRLVQSENPSEWFELEDRAVESLVAHLGIREGTGQVGHYENGTSGLLVRIGTGTGDYKQEKPIVGDAARFPAYMDETIKLVGRVFKVSDSVPERSALELPSETSHDSSAHRP